MATQQELAQRWSLPGTPVLSRVGAAIASAATIAPTHPIHEVTGTTAIATITPPYSGFSGQITLIFTNANPGGVTTGGNIAVAKDPAQNMALTLTYHPVLGFWYSEFPAS